MDKVYYIYMLKCSNGAFYTGYTKDLTRRLSEHKRQSSQSKYTRSFPMQYLASSWKLQTTQAYAMFIERRIKKLSRIKKELLVSEPSFIQHILFPIFVPLT